MATLERSEIEGVTLLRLRGELTVEGVMAVEQAFTGGAQRPGVCCVADLTGVEIITTPAISMFIAAATYAKKNGGRLIIAGPPPRVQDMLRWLRLQNVLPMVPTVEEAVRLAREASGRETQG